MDHGIALRLTNRFRLDEKGENGLALHDLEHPRMRPLQIDFTSPEILRRVEDSLRSPTELLRAIEGRRGRSEAPLRICDAMAGLGQDAHLLARRGHCVDSYEQDPLIAEMLRAARAHLPKSLRWQINFGQVRSLPLDAEKWDVLYLDPMFPERKDGALQNRSMQILKNWLETAGPAPQFNLSEWLNWARVQRIAKVVYKAPIHLRLPDALQATQTSEVVGKAVRFHVFFQNLNSGSL